MKKLFYGLKLFSLMSFRLQIQNTSIGEIYHLIKNFHFVYPAGKLMLFTHLFFLYIIKKDLSAATVTWRKKIRRKRPNLSRALSSVGIDDQ
jgi:hypothetical protein